MKIVFFGYDQTLDIAQRLIADGHEIIGIFTFACDNVFAFNTHIQNFAHECNIPCRVEKITAEDINFFTATMGAEAFLVCGYPYKVPPIDERKAYGLNLHPALLPRARGIMPLPYILMHEPQAAGLTLHKLSSHFDAGDILAQAPLSLLKGENVDFLNARLGVLSPDFVSQCIANIEALWRGASPQDEDKASHYGAPDEAMRTLDWAQGTDEISKKMRAFGRFGTFATLTNNVGQSQKIIVYQGRTWQQEHKHPCGTLIKSSPREIIVSLPDGYACLNEFQAFHEE